MSVRTIYSCDFCGEETENAKAIDFLNVSIGNIAGQMPAIKQVCRHCVQAIDQARGRTI